MNTAELTTVSFIIIAYNEEKALPNALEALRRQTYDHGAVEVILVDGGSRDQTKELMTSFANSGHSFRRVAVCDNPKRTLPCGWNVALEKAACDVILRVDAHAYIPEDFIEKNVRCIQNGEDICGGKVNSIAVNEDNWSSTVNLAEKSMFGGSFAKFRRVDTAGYVDTLAFAAYRRTVFDKVGKYNELLARTEDNEMHYRMRKVGFKFYYTPEIESCRETRNSFRKLFKQKYLNGYWIGLTLGVCPRCFSAYHLVPFVFVVALLLSVILALAWSPLPLACLAGLYGLCLVFFTVEGARGQRFHPFMLFMPALFFLLHASYGSGTLAGLLRMPFWRMRGTKKTDNIKEITDAAG